MPDLESEGPGVWADDEERARRGREAYEQEQLERYAQQVSDLHEWTFNYPMREFGARVADMWVFFDGDVPRERETTLGLIRMFTGLGLEPTGFLKADVFIGMYDRLAALEQEVRSSRLGG